MALSFEILKMGFDPDSEDAQSAYENMQAELNNPKKPVANLKACKIIENLDVLDGRRLITIVILPVVSITANAAKNPELLLAQVKILSTMAPGPGKR